MSGARLYAPGEPAPETSSHNAPDPEYQHNPYPVPALWNPELATWLPTEPLPAGFVLPAVDEVAQHPDEVQPPVQSQSQQENPPPVPNAAEQAPAALPEPAQQPPQQAQSAQSPVQSPVQPPVQSPVQPAVQIPVQPPVQIPVAPASQQDPVAALTQALVHLQHQQQQQQQQQAQALQLVQQQQNQTMQAMLAQFQAQVNSQVPPPVPQLAPGDLGIRDYRGSSDPAATEVNADEHAFFFEWFDPAMVALRGSTCPENRFASVLFAAVQGPARETLLLQHPKLDTSQISAEQFGDMMRNIVPLSAHFSTRYIMTHPFGALSLRLEVNRWATLARQSLMGDPDVPRFVCFLCEELRNRVQAFRKAFFVEVQQKFGLVYPQPGTASLDGSVQSIQRMIAKATAVGMPLSPDAPALPGQPEHEQQRARSRSRRRERSQPKIQPADDASAALPRAQPVQPPAVPFQPVQPPSAAQSSVPRSAPRSEAATRLSDSHRSHRRADLIALARQWNRCVHCGRFEDNPLTLQAHQARCDPDQAEQFNRKMSVVRISVRNGENPNARFRRSAVAVVQDNDQAQVQAPVQNAQVQNAQAPYVPAPPPANPAWQPGAAPPP